LSPSDSMSLDAHLTEIAGLDSSRQPGGSRSKKKKQVPKRKSTIKDAFPDYLQESFFGRDLLDDGTDRDPESGTERLSLMVNIEQPESSKSIAKVTTTTLNGRHSAADSKLDIKLEPSTSTSAQPKSASKTTTSIPLPDVSLTEDDDDFAGFGDDGVGGAADFLADLLPGDDEFMSVFLATDQDEDATVPEEEHNVSVSRPAKETEHDIGTDNLYAPYIESLESTDLPQITSEDAEDVFNDVFLGDGPGVSLLAARNFSSEVGGSAGNSAVTTPPIRSSLSMPMTALALNDHLKTEPWPGQCHSRTNFNSSFFCQGFFSIENQREFFFS
jgi:hypothetical protein